MYNITNKHLKTTRTPLVINDTENYIFHEINSTYYKSINNNNYYVHSFIITADETTKEEVKVDIIFNLEILEDVFNIETFLQYNLPDILAAIDEQRNQIPKRLFDLKNFRHICYSYSSEIEPIEHVLPKKV